jgi:hypothetical protein
VASGGLSWFGSNITGDISNPQLAIIPFVPAHAARLETIRAEAFIAERLSWKSAA